MQHRKGPYQFRSSRPRPFAVNIYLLQPLDVNIYHLTIMATKMPYAGRG